MIAVNQSSFDESGLNYHDDDDNGMQLKRQLTSEGSYDEESNEDVLEHDSVDQPNDSITQEVVRMVFTLVPLQLSMLGYTVSDVALVKLEIHKLFQE